VDSLTFLPIGRRILPNPDSEVHVALSRRIAFCILGVYGYCRYVPLCLLASNAAGPLLDCYCAVLCGPGQGGVTGTTARTAAL
jgi:hypothetical protein